MLKPTYSRLKAKELLIHYFKLLADKTGTFWNFDNESEISSLVDYLIEAAVEEIKQEAILA